jgi:LysR family hydrogen peroxide-inducible transcriptional activator
MGRFAPHPCSLRQLQYAVAVAETLSFRRAAELCHVSQPSLSAQLAELEAALGVRLFERDRRRVLPTPAGRELLGRARAVLLQADDLLQAARRVQDPLSGTLRIGVLPTVAPYLLPEVAPVLTTRLPRLTVVWIEERTSRLVAELRGGELDAAVLALEAELGDGLEQVVLFRDPFLLATPPGHPLSGSSARPVRLGQLAGSTVLLLDDGHCLRDQALSFCQRADVHVAPYRATSLATLSRLVAAGAGITLIPELAAGTETHHTKLVLRPLAAPAPGRTVALVWRKGSPLEAALREVARAMARPAPSRREKEKRSHDR